MTERVSGPQKALRRRRKSEREKLRAHLKAAKLKSTHRNIFFYLYWYRDIVVSVQQLQAIFFPGYQENRQGLHQAIMAIRKRLEGTGYQLLSDYKVGNKRTAVGYVLVPVGFKPVSFDLDTIFSRQAKDPQPPQTT